MQGEDRNLPAVEAETEPATEVIDDTVEMQRPEAQHARLQQELQDVQNKVADYWDRIVRQQAEMDNLRKRAERDVENARKYALERFAGDLLPVKDSLELGLAAADAQSGAEKIREGLELTLKMLADTLARHGVKEVNPLGERFNPEWHQAMTMQPSAEVEPNTVLTVVQKGYVLNDRLLRPAMVIVAKAPA